MTDEAIVRGEWSASEHASGQALQATQQRILELAAENRPLSEALDSIVRGSD